MRMKSPIKFILFMKKGLNPKSNFSNYLLAFLEEGIYLKPHSQKGYLKFFAKTGLTLEPVIVEFENDCTLFLHFSGGDGSVCLDFIRVFVKENVKAKLFFLLKMVKEE